MSNALSTDITDKFVVIRQDWFKYDMHKNDVRERVFLAQGGYGCHGYTRGTAVVGEFAVDGERTRIEGYDIEALAAPDEIEAALKERAERGIAIDDRMQAVLDTMAGA